MFDLQATLRWVGQVVTDPNGAAAAYKEAGPPWMTTFLQITLPAYAGALVVGAILAWITGGSLMYGGLSFGLFLFTLIWSLAWTFVVALLFDVLAGTFDGERNFDAAYALVGLAIIPAALGNAIAPLPWLGWLLSLAASIYSIVLAYRFVPVFLAVPEANRVKHFVLTIVAAIVVNIVVVTVFGGAFMASRAPDFSDYNTDVTNDAGMFGSVGRQASIAEAAGQDRYEPPADGELSEDQVEAYVDVLKKTQQLRERLSAKLENMEEEPKSVTDIFGGVGDAMRMGTAEMEVVKSAGGNWAEHMWVKSQIETARVQQDINDAVAHNYDLFLEYQDEIEAHE